MANKVSNEQLEELLDFLASHSTLDKGVGLGARSKETVDKLWNDLARRLNSFGSGSSKTGERWKKYWNDLKHKSKSRLAKQKRDLSGTGGGPATQDAISEIDKKVLAIISEQAVYGDSNLRVPLFNSSTIDHTTDIQEQLDIPDDLVLNLAANSPSLRGETSRIDTSEAPAPQHSPNIILEPQPTTSSQDHILLGQQPTVLGSPVSRPHSQPRRRRLNQTSSTNIHSINIPSTINSNWVVELERNRVTAETRLADATHIIAEAAHVVAQATQAMVEVVHEQSTDIRMLIELMREQRNRYLIHFLACRLLHFH